MTSESYLNVSENLAKQPQLGISLVDRFPFNINLEVCLEDYSLARYFLCRSLLILES